MKTENKDELKSTLIAAGIIAVCFLLAYLYCRVPYPATKEKENQAGIIK